MAIYLNGKIYMITTNHNCKIYIGSTTLTLEERIKDHKTRYNLWKIDPERQSFLSSFELLDFDDYKIELIENFPCETEQDLRNREGFYMKLHRPFIVNIHILTRTDKEWRDEHKSYIKECNKKYYQENKEQIKEQHKQYIADNPEKIKQTRKSHYEKNKVAILAKDKIYKNLEDVKARAIARNHSLRKCDTCNIEVKTHCYHAHLKTKQHRNNLDRIL
jgi:hypothetical protein